MAKNYRFIAETHQQNLLKVLKAAEQLLLKGKLDQKSLTKILKANPKSAGELFSKQQLLAGYNFLVSEKLLAENNELEISLKMKPTRSISGVAPLTVLTMPFPCPGKCIFCPSDVRMPKSYLSDEPGAQRAARNAFDPYKQTFNRLLAFSKTGHQVSKVELLVLGGTWSFYPEKYQVWFISECFRALNDFANKKEPVAIDTVALESEQPQITESEVEEKLNYNKTVLRAANNNERVSSYLTPGPADQQAWDNLEKLHDQNSRSDCRCVGLVLETRPDYVTEMEIIRMRKLGATKIQLGYQSLNDEILKVNKRGHDVAAISHAVSLARAAGFKIQAHWMPNLLGATVESDKKDFLRIFTPEFQPDELKIYPCSLVKTAELYRYYKQGLWKPYTEQELLELLVFCFRNVPRQVRLSRVIRDIPSQDIVVGNTKSNFRQLVENHLANHESASKDIRAREVKAKKITNNDLTLKITSYQAKSLYSVTSEYFLEFITEADQIAAFIRLSIPTQKITSHFISELENAAIIREVHVYGVAQNLGEKSVESSQHLGLGSKLLIEAKKLASKHNYQKLAVISAIGTREYYQKRGFEIVGNYQIAEL